MFVIAIKRCSHGTNMTFFEKNMFQLSDFFSYADLRLSEVLRGKIIDIFYVITFLFHLCEFFF